MDIGSDVPGFFYRTDRLTWWVKLTGKTRPIAGECLVI